MKKTILIHACWLVACLAAFFLGGRSVRTTTGETGSNSQSAQNVSSDAETGISSEERRARSNDRTAQERSTSTLETALGSIASSKNLQTLIEQALKSPSPITRRLAFSRLLEALTPENAAAIRSQLVELGADGDQWRDFHYSWGAIAGKAAFDHASASAETDLAATLTGWAAANPAQAMTVLDALPAELEGQRDELTASLVSGLADNNTALATDLVLNLAQQGNERAGNLMEIVASETLRNLGPEQASQWAESLPNGPLKGSAMSRIADSYVRMDPVAASKWAERYADQEYATRSIETIGGRWAQVDPLAAVGWLEGLPPSNGQRAGLRNAFSDWEDRDPAKASEYLSAMPQSAQRDSAVSGFAMGYAWQNPQIAIAWAQDIQDPALRQSSLTRAGQAYYRRDPNGALAWLETSGLPADAQQQILNSNNRR